MPYLLPADPDVSELDCVLVYFPNAPEYRQALFGQLAELSDVWNWEGTREAQALARVAWLAAELETINNMTCLDELLAEVQAINAKLPWCCEDGTGYSEGVEGGGGTVTIWPTPGPAPLPIPDTDFGTDDYPVTDATDPDGGGTVSEADWEQYLCGAANYLIDSIIDYLRFVRFQRSFTSSFLGVIRWLQARIAGAIIPGAADDFALWELNDLLDTVIGAFEDVPIAVIDQALLDLESLREDIVCAILGENVAQNAIDAALTIIFGSIDNALAQSLIGNPVALFASLIWNGAIDVAWRDDCECAGTPAEATTGLIFTVVGANGGNTTANENNVTYPAVAGDGFGGAGVFSSSVPLGNMSASFPLEYNRISQGVTPYPVTTIVNSSSWNPVGSQNNPHFGFSLLNNHSGARFVGLEIRIDYVLDGGVWYPVTGVTLQATSGAGSAATVDGTRILFPAITQGNTGADDRFAYVSVAY